MEVKYLEKYFINPAIECGIKAYLDNKEGISYKRAYTFEMHVIKALTIIYGEKSILLPYKIDNEKAFECNLLIYDLKETDMKKFIKYMNDYHEFMKNYKSEMKATGLINEIETLLMEMIKKRNKRKEFTKEEITEFDTIFNPLDGDLKKIKSLLSCNSGLIIKNWSENKQELTNTQIQLMTINPNLLNPNLYSKFGYDIRNVALLNSDEIEKINSKILYEENCEYQSSRKKDFKRKNILLTSGNGFVDKLMLMSIVATEIMIGFIIVSVLGG